MQAIVGLLQCGLIYFGLRQMGEASDERNRDNLTSTDGNLTTTENPWPLLVRESPHC